MKKKKLPLYSFAAIGVVVILVVYLLFVQGPIKTETKELEAKRISLENELFQLQPYITQKHNWEEELDKIKKSGNATSIPDYDNINNIISEMHMILGDINNFSINYGNITVENNIVTRVLDLSFTAKNYDLLKEKISAIHDSPYKYQITDIAISSNANGEHSCRMAIVAYEYNESNEIN